MNFKKQINDNKELIIKNLQKLLQIKSVYDQTTISDFAPFGSGIDECLTYMLELAQKDGFEIYRDGGYAGDIRYGTGQETIGILCHLDVVPEGSNWDYPPYGGVIANNRIYARGALDDKGPTMAVYYALKFIKDAGIKLNKEVRIILGTDEETGWRGVAHYFQNNKMPEIGFSPDASFPLVYGEKGRMALDFTLMNHESCENKNDILVSLKGGERYNVVIDQAVAVAKINLANEFASYLEKHQLQGDITLQGDYYEYHLQGVSAHAMEPQKGINAGVHLCNFFKEYSNNPLVQFLAKYNHLDYHLEGLGLSYVDEEMGPITCNVGIIDINATNCLMTYDIRYPERYNQLRFESEIQKKAADFGLKITKFTHKKPHYVSPDDDLVKLLYQAYVKHTGDRINKPFTIGGGTYASMMPKAVAYGMEMPGEEVLVHQRNEYLDLDIFFTSILIYIDAILLLGGYNA